MSSIPGYTHGTSAVAKSPVTLADFEQMKASVLFGEDDVKYLRMSHDVVKDEVEAILDVWYGFVGSQPHLLASFTGKRTASPSATTSAPCASASVSGSSTPPRRVRPEVARLPARDRAPAPPAKKNKTDGAPSTDLVPFRNLFALIFPVTFTLRPFLAKKGHSAEDVEKMYAAWVKSCLLQVTLWSHPYVKDGDF
jgi:hypothetical protein